MTNPIARIERHDYRDPLGHPLGNDVDWKAVKGGNHALADRLLQDAARIEYWEGPDCTATVQNIREAAAALTSPQADKARVPDGLIDALRSQRQVDEDGSECGVSRQAVDEAIEILESLATPQPQGDASQEGVAVRVHCDRMAAAASGDYRIGSPERIAQKMRFHAKQLDAAPFRGGDKLRSLADEVAALSAAKQEGES